MTHKNYLQCVNSKMQQIVDTKQAVILAIESSCDETSASVVANGRQMLSNVIYSQISLHREYGGVVPELASRSHVEVIGGVVDKALKDASIDLGDVDAIAVTEGPGLIGCLLVGVGYAKGLAFAKKLPLIPVHHIVGHISANYIAYGDLTPPFICLVASGGHSQIVAVEDYRKITVLGTTKDDAAGEAFDKAARALGLPYPGGPHLEKLAQKGDPDAFAFHSAFNSSAHYDLSFSGMKTAIINQIHNAEQKGTQIPRADLAASFQKAVVNAMTEKALRACREFGYTTLALAGGVAANTYLRNNLTEQATSSGIRFCCPPIELCTDNAAMIAGAAYYQAIAGEFAPLSLNATANKKMGA